MDVFNDADAFIDDLEILEIIQHGFPRRIYERADHYNTLDDLEFFRRFRLTKKLCFDVVRVNRGRPRIS